MRLRVFIEDSFDAAHWLPNVPLVHKCHALHGHTYKIRLEFEGQPGRESGWILDYAEAKCDWDKLKILVDHKCLNDIEQLENPTCEKLTQYIERQMQAYPSGRLLRRIELRETEKCGAVLEYE